MKWGRYQVVTRRQALIAAAILFLAAVLLVVLAAAIPYAYSTATAAMNKKQPICCTDRSNMVVSLTFDAKQGNKHINELIAVLKQYDVTATFFVTGEWTERYSDSVRALDAAGQEIMNGSDLYPHMVDLSRDKMIEEIKACSDKIQAATNKRPSLFRSPYDEYSNTLLETVDMLDMYAVGWDVDSLDDKGLTADGITLRVVSQASSGSIIRFHTDGDHTAEALKSVIEKLKGKGYTFLPVSQMIYKEHYVISRSGRQIASAE